MVVASYNVPIRLNYDPETEWTPPTPRKRPRRVSVCVRERERERDRISGRVREYRGPPQVVMRLVALLTTTPFHYLLFKQVFLKNFLPALQAGLGMAKKWQCYNLPAIRA